MKQKEIFLPKARKADLVSRQIPGELLVYDLKRHKAFCLNDTAAKIWRQCNGKRTVANLAAELEKDLQSPIDSRIIGLALNQLEKSQLLQRQAGGSVSLPISRRALIRAGIATAITLPIVTMIAAPSAQAQGTEITQQVCRQRSAPKCGGTACIDQARKPCLVIAGGCDCG
jgi:Coenzyme PQQ synthesis protein D (PqqD)